MWSGIVNSIFARKGAALCSVQFTCLPGMVGFARVIGRRRTGSSSQQRSFPDELTANHGHVGPDEGLGKALLARSAEPEDTGLSANLS